MFNGSNLVSDDVEFRDGKATCILSLILMLGTLFISLSMYGFRTTPYLVTTVRDIISDYALPVGVIISTLVGYFVFSGVYRKFRRKIEIEIRMPNS